MAMNPKLHGIRAEYPTAPIVDLMEYVETLKNPLDEYPSCNTFKGSRYSRWQRMEKCSCCSRYTLNPV